MTSRLDALPDLELLGRAAGFKVGALARSVGVSRESLRVYVQVRFHEAPKDWLARLRMREAQRLLSQGQLVKEITSTLGFQHATHFSRAFRRGCGSSPRVFVAVQTGEPGGALGK